MAVKFKNSDGIIRHATIESILEGDFIKWSNNADYMKAEEDKDFSATLSAFTDWTYEITKGYLMIVDVQGIKSPSGEEFILTDPAIHCKNTDRFGGTNLGVEGMNLFFSKHKCNSMCRALKLLPHSACPGFSEHGTLPVV
uniref:Alpha-type protein kinase domain-containing protein n=1 Tax=Guillardia theta TaxID=55529 RepID=A0A7S4KWC7_GUITH|mmetsp:Transcript_32402/g.102836  ORF Transcript_32402/g.102836 Transcript_32402/m.102836 type:complete len:140 (+) Transcript_32402:122-541(+)